MMVSVMWGCGSPGNLRTFFSAVPVGWDRLMSRFRLYPDVAQEEALLVHCGHARFVWNLCVEQQPWWNPRCGPAPGYAEWNRQLTAARGACDWLAAGSVIV